MTRYLRLWAELLKLSWQRERRLTALVFALEAGSVVANVVIALSLRFAVDYLIDHREPLAIGAACGAAIACAAALVANRLHGLVGLFLIVEKLGVVLDSRMMSDIAALEGIEHLERPEYLDRISLLQGGARRLVGGMWTAVRSVFTMLQVVLTLLLLGAVGPWLLLLLALAVAPLLSDWAGRRIETRTETDTADAFRLQRHLFELATEAGPAKDIQVARVGGTVANRQAEAWDRATIGRFRARVRAAGLRALGWSVFAAGFVLVLGLLVRRASTGAATAGEVVMVVTLAITLQQTVQTMVGQWTTTMSAGLFIEPYLWLRSYVTADRRLRTGSESAPDALHEGIRLTGVGYTYPGTVSPAVKDIDVFMPAGAVVALVGEHGSGKTTLVKLLSKFYRPQAGTITLDGVDLAAVETEAWRVRTSAAYQDFGRYPQSTFAEAVGLGDVAHIADRRRRDEAIRAADATRLVERLPDGISTRLSPQYGGVELSEGQWQKTALARACMRTGPLLFMLDEPTAALDAPSEHAIFERYMAQARRQAALNGTVTLVVSHRLSTVASADLVLVLERGRLVEQGTHEQLLALGGRYSTLYALQARAYEAVPRSDAVSAEAERSAT
ncbi:ATP-binding cassette domain-containing protein [Streptomyces silvisoli]|uniref:ABC transporter ATP-binding protein n=1 Tax=Streptomyces silvisoli TaxID=3034235 RepID=A0ABT5ZKE7_9ACTN|nr:ABC transporter ATP-binding protein [Streptomyces silvisoli]MDF3290308.1 ABC transporter ATP-binding protein [Streptomyces silvisoli]